MKYEQSAFYNLQLEVEFETLAHVEEFWAAIPPAEHRAWSQRAQVTTPLIAGLLRGSLPMSPVVRIDERVQCTT